MNKLNFIDSLISRFGLPLAMSVLFSVQVFGAVPSAINPIEDRLKTLESLSLQVSRDAELTLHLYQMAMNMAIEEAKSEIQTLRSNQHVQQCSSGIDRVSTCLIAWRDATRILDAAFVRRSVAGTTNEFRVRLNQIADFADRGGVFAPLPTVGSDDGVFTSRVFANLVDGRRIKKCAELQQGMVRTLTSLGNALINNSSILISTRAILEPMRVMAERPPTERVDVVYVILTGLDAAQAELNRAKVDTVTTRESKSALHKLLLLRNLGQPGF